jgi:hypothetical protein
MGAGGRPGHHAPAFGARVTLGDKAKELRARFNREKAAIHLLANLFLDKFAGVNSFQNVVFFFSPWSAIDRRFARWQSQAPRLADNGAFADTHVAPDFRR